MPQASDEDRARMTTWFGDISDGPPLFFLLSHGFREERGYISPPTPSHNMSEDEFHCIRFLFDEWDYDYAGAQK